MSYDILEEGFPHLSLNFLNCFSHLREKLPFPPIAGHFFKLGKVTFCSALSNGKLIGYGDESTFGLKVDKVDE